MFFLVRHGERADNTKDSYNKVEIKKSDDPPLTKKGHEMAFETGQWLREQLQILKQNKQCSENAKFVQISSPYYRCLQTSRMIREGLGLEFVKNQNLLVEDAIEEKYCDYIEISQDTRQTRFFSNLEKNQEIRKELFAELNPVSNSFFDYEKNSELIPKWIENTESVKERFRIAYEYVMGRNCMDEVYVLVSHGISFGALNDLVYDKGKAEYCAASLVVRNDDKSAGDGFLYKLLIKNHYAYPRQ